jgi:hypothetical protein
MRVVMKPLPDTPSVVRPDWRMTRASVGRRAGSSLRPSAITPCSDGSTPDQIEAWLERDSLPCT